MTMSGGPTTYFFLFTMWDVVFNLMNGDVSDGYWYNNNTAVGSQLYPTGLSKYFDMNSWDGFITFSIEWLWILLWNAISPFTLFIPINLWIAMFTLSWVNFD